MPRRIKGTSLKGRKVRDLETGKFYTTKGYVSCARKGRLQFIRQKDEKLASLKKATKQSLTPTGIKNRSIAYATSTPEIKAARKQRVLDRLGWDNPEAVARRLLSDRNQHASKTIVVDGQECTFRESDCVGDELGIVYMNCEREPSVGVSVV